MHLVGFLLHATKCDWKSALQIPTYCVSAEIQGSVCCKWAAIHLIRWVGSSALWWYSRATEGWTRRLIHWLKLTQFCVSLLLCRHIKVAFNKGVFRHNSSS